MADCPTCGKVLKKDIENVYEIDGTRYYDVRLTCSECGYTKPLTISRKDPLPKAQDSATELTASLRLREYLPDRGIDKTGPRSLEKPSKRASLKEILQPLKHLKEITLYIFALGLGVFIELGGLYFESYLRTVRIFPYAGFVVSLLIFVFGPILIVGSLVYYVTRDRLKAILMGSIAVPLTIIIIANLRLEALGI